MPFADRAAQNTVASLLPQRIKIFGRRVNIANMSARTGVSSPHLSRIFSGKRDPSVKTAMAIAADIGVSMDEFVTFLTTRKFKKRKD